MASEARGTQPARNAPASIEDPAPDDLPAQRLLPSRENLTFVTNERAVRERWRKADWVRWVTSVTGLNHLEGCTLQTLQGILFREKKNAQSEPRRKRRRREPPSGQDHRGPAVLPGAPAPADGPDEARHSGAAPRGQKQEKSKKRSHDASPANTGTQGDSAAAAVNGGAQGGQFDESGNSSRDFTVRDGKQELHSGLVGSSGAMMLGNLAVNAPPPAKKARRDSARSSGAEHSE